MPYTNSLDSFALYDSYTILHWFYTLKTKQKLTIIPPITLSLTRTNGEETINLCISNNPFLTLYKTSPYPEHSFKPSFENIAHLINKFIEHIEIFKPKSRKDWYCIELPTNNLVFIRQYPPTVFQVNARLMLLDQDYCNYIFKRLHRKHPQPISYRFFKARRWLSKLFKRPTR